MIGPKPGPWGSPKEVFPCEEMPLILRFRVSPVRTLAMHAEGTIRHRMTLEQRRDRYGNYEVETDEGCPPGLWLCRDDGIYLMSNGDPHLPKTSGGPNESFVEYAHGFDSCGWAEKEAWDELSTSIGGSDFVFFLALPDVFSILAQKEPNWENKRFMIGIRGDRVWME